MFHSSFRAVVLALALVVQTVAGGYGVGAMSAAHMSAAHMSAAHMSAAHMSSAHMSTGVGARAAHCEHGSTNDQSLPGGSGHRTHDCLSCQACANLASVASPPVSAEFRAVLHDSVRIGLAFDAVVGRSSRSAHAHRARAPPAFS